jgi:prepilin-type N-terminal cleavage/methylation domain-containing protein
MKNKKGFTLIELLVVVLIIGILAAIALPQYQTAVLNSKAASVISMVRAIADAEERYFLATGEYTSNFNDLDVSIADCSDQCIINGFGFYIRQNAAILGYAQPTSSELQSGLVILKLFDSPAGKDVPQFKKGDIVCVDRDKAQYRKVCQSLGGKESVSWRGASWKI